MPEVCTGTPSQTLLGNDGRGHWGVYITPISREGALHMAQGGTTGTVPPVCLLHLLTQG